MVVSAAALTVTGSGTQTYGGSPTYAAAYSGFVLGQGVGVLSGTLAFSTTTSSSSPVGTYTGAVTPSGLTSSNYAITFASGNMVVNLAALTVTASPETKTYGQTLTFGSGSMLFTSSGLQNGQTIGTVTLAVSNNGGAATAAAGSYTITANAATGGTFTASNYTITYATGTLTVSKDSTTTTVASSLNPSNSGQSVTFTATVSANSPGSGTPTGTVTFLDDGTSLGTGTNSVVGGNLVATFSTSSLSVGTQSITVNYGGDGNFVNSTLATPLSQVVNSASGNAFANPSIYVLNGTAAGALTLSGNAQIQLTGVVDVDSNSTSAINASGNAIISASGILVVGKTLTSGNAHLSTTVTGAASFSDPLASLAAPSTTGLTNYPAVNLSGNSSQTINPGIYSSIAVSGNGNLTMTAGTYIIQGGGFSVSGNGSVSTTGTNSVSGTGVMIYNAGSSSGTYGSVTLSGNGNISLTPETTGTYAGILIYQPAPTRRSSR